MNAIASAWGGNGVYAESDHQSTGTVNALYATVSNSNDYAAYFVGQIYATGKITGASKDFKIDDPMSPPTSYLYHADVESPELKTFYDGRVTLDSTGEAAVQLPSYFQALNTSFQYQLTCVGQFSPVYVASEVVNNSFTIAGGLPGQTVSWQVTGVRQDAWALANPLVPEVDKEPQNQGHYLNPEAFGLPETMMINYLPPVPATALPPPPTPPPVPFANSGVN